MISEHSPFFYTDPSRITGSQVVIEGADARHLKLVRRAEPGDLIHVCDGDGRILDARISEITDDRLVGEVVKDEQIELVLPRLTVLQGLAKGAKVDLIVQKLVEVGVEEVIVFLSGRSIPRWDDRRAGKAGERWRAIAREAAKQSRRPWLPRISGPVDVTSAARMIEGLILVAHESAEVPLRAALPESPPERICLVVGPEGGLDESDLAVFTVVGGKTVSLGRLILRTETAALVAASAILYHYGLIG